MALLNREFYARRTLTVARELLGKRLVRQRCGALLSGTITETEAYGGSEDSASHAFRGMTPRNTVMFGRPGTAYVYLVYGRHHMLNIVTETEGVLGAVLLRGMAPLEGRGRIEPWAGRAGDDLVKGPGRLCRALDVDGSLNGVDLTRRGALWVEAQLVVPSELVRSGPRVGIDYAKPEGKRAPWRFWISET